MKKMVVTLACVLIVPLAFAQTSSTGKGQKGQGATTTTEPITVTGTPVKTLVVREDSSNKQGTYVIRGPGHVMNKAGEPIRTAIKPGTRVRVFYVNIGNSRVVDHVMVQ
jgi:hypothetical protein